MLASELLQRLSDLFNEYGDLEVGWDTGTAILPITIDYALSEELGYVLSRDPNKRPYGVSPENALLFDIQNPGTAPDAKLSALTREDGTTVGGTWRGERFRTGSVPPAETIAQNFRGDPGPLGDADFPGWVNGSYRSYRSEVQPMTEPAVWDGTSADSPTPSTPLEAAEQASRDNHPSARKGPFRG